MSVQNKMAPVFSITRFDINFLENAGEFNRGRGHLEKRFKVKRFK